MPNDSHASNVAAVVTKVFEVLNAHDLDALAALVADDVSEDWPLIGHLDGRAAVLEHFRNLLGATPDLHLEVLKMAESGETVFVHWRARGRFSGTPFAGMLATGRSIDLRGTDCFTIRDGKVAANFIAFDGMTFGVQAGVLPRPGSFGDRMMTGAVNALTRMKALRSG